MWIFLAHVQDLKSFSKEVCILDFCQIPKKGWKRKKHLWAAWHSAAGTGRDAPPGDQTWWSAEGCAPTPSPPPVRTSIVQWANGDRLPPALHPHINLKVCQHSEGRRRSRFSIWRWGLGSFHRALRRFWSIQPCALHGDYFGFLLVWERQGSTLMDVSRSLLSPQRLAVLQLRSQMPEMEARFSTDVTAEALR